MKNPKTKILIVDDNKVKLITSQKNIKNKLGIDSKIVESGFDAVKEFKKNNDYNIIILDILMPQMDGFKTAANIKKYCDKKDVKLPHIIFYSILETKEIQQKAVDCGIIDHVPAGHKEKLIKAVQKWIMHDNEDFFIC